MGGSLGSNLAERTAALNFDGASIRIHTEIPFFAYLGTIYLHQCSMLADWAGIPYCFPTKGTRTAIGISC